MPRSVRSLGSIVILLSSGCGDDGPNDNGDTRTVNGIGDCAVHTEGYYYIGLAGVYSGEVGSEEDAMLDTASLMALEEINNNGGLHGKPLGLVICDSQRESAPARRVAEELSTLPHLVGAFSAGSVTLIEGWPYFVQARRPLVAAAGIELSAVMGEAGGADLRAIHDGYVYATGVTIYVGQAEAALLEATGKESVIFIIEERAAGAIAEGIRGQYAFDLVTANEGITATKHVFDSTVSAATFAESAVQAIEDSGASTVYFGTPGTTYAAIMDQIEAVGLSGLGYILDASSARAIDLVSPELAEGTTMLYETAQTGEGADTFNQNYLARWSTELDSRAAGIVSLMYDAMFFLAIGAELSADPESGPAVRDGLGLLMSGTKIFPGQWDQVLQHKAEGSLDYQGAYGDLDFLPRGTVAPGDQSWVMTFMSGSFVPTGCLTVSTSTVGPFPCQ